MTAAPLVAVLLGTDHHPFDRLVGWTSEVRRATGVEVFVQHGSTTLPPDLPGAPMLGSTELMLLLERATAVVTHGGPGLIMEARGAGHVPVVVPRDPRLGEHVDDHQLRFVARIGSTGLVAPAPRLSTFRRAVAVALVGGSRGTTQDDGPRPDDTDDGHGTGHGAGHGTGRATGTHPASAPASARFGRLVDDLLHRV